MRVARRVCERVVLAVNGHPLPRADAHQHPGEDPEHSLYAWGEPHGAMGETAMQVHRGDQQGHLGEAKAEENRSKNRKHGSGQAISTGAGRGWW